MNSETSLKRVDVVSLTLSMLMLAAWLPPLLVQAHEESREMQCADRLKNVTGACLQFAQARNRTLPSNRRQPFTSWNTLVLPYMDREDLYDQYDFSSDWWEASNRDLGATHLPELVCPEAPHGDRQLRLVDADGRQFRAAATDYIASAGAYLGTNKPEHLYRGAMASSGRQYGASGVTAGHAVRLAEITDGLSSSLLIVEMADKPNVWRAGKLSDDRLGNNSERTLVEGFSFGQWVAPNWNHLRSYDPDGTRQFGNCGVNCANGGSIYAFHAKTANVAFADGAVRPLRAGLDQDVMVALVSIADAELIAPADYIPK